MRVGLFFGIDGDATALEAALALLSDCDRIVCLGDLLGAAGRDDARCLEALEAGRFGMLAGAAEQLRAHDRTLPPEVRARLRALLPATVEEGVALLGGLAAAAGVRKAPDGHPRLVAPLAVAGHRGATRLWRGASGLARVEELAGPPVGAAPRGAESSLPLGASGPRLRLDLGPARGDDGAIRVAVVDRAAATLSIRACAPAVRAAERPAAPAAVSATMRVSPARRRRRTPVAEGQQLLAV